MGKTIDYRFKLLYFFGMLFVVSAHCYVLCAPLTLNETFPFAGTSLPLFVFASGYFYNSKAEEDPKGFIIKKAKTLLLPMMIYNVFYGILTQILKAQGFDLGQSLSFESLVLMPYYDGHQFLLMMGGWFIAPLFCCQIITMLVRKIFKAWLKPLPEWGYMLLAFAMALGGNELACLGFLNGWWMLLARFSSFIIFFAFGIFYRTTLEKYDSKVPAIITLIVAFAIRYGLNVFFGRKLFYTPSWCDDYLEGPLMPIVVGLLGIMFWFSVAKLLTPFIGKLKLINLVADNTYSIMMNQFLGFWLVKYLYYFLSLRIGSWPEFDMVAFKGNIWYYYNPPHQLKTVYLIVGLAFPILVQYVINLVKRLIRKAYQESLSVRKLEG